MSRLGLQLRNGNTEFRPGDPVRGEADWKLECAAAWIEIRLLWYTEGKGDSDFAVVDRGQVDHPMPSGAFEFDLDMPAGPYSFHGRYLSILWALELVADGVRDGARVDLTLAPEGYEVDLPQR